MNLTEAVRDGRRTTGTQAGSNAKHRFEHTSLKPTQSALDLASCSRECGALEQMRNNLSKTECFQPGKWESTTAIGVGCR